MADIISCKNLGIYYKDLSDHKLHRIHRMFHRSNKKWALRDISFDIQEGDIVGILGKNGAGKSTLAKALAGIYKPDKGSIKVAGKTTLLSLALGFNNELTGIDNIYINAMYQGIKKQEIKKKIPEIIEFAELEEHIDKPLKYYSSGMKARLAFATATCQSPEILILDEALSAGDISFQAKSGARLKEIMMSAKCVIIISHSGSFLRFACNKGILIHNGSSQGTSPIADALLQYETLVNSKKKATAHAL